MATSRNDSNQSAGRHARHAAGQPAPTRRSAPTPRMRETSASGQPINVARTDDEYGSHVSAARTDALNTLSAGQGARVTDRGNASEAADRARANAERRFETRHGHGSKPTTDPRRIVTVVIAAMLVLVAVFAIVRCATSGESSSNTSTSTDQSTSSSSSSSSIVVPDGGVTYDGIIFTLSQQSDGLWTVVGDDGVNSPATVFGVDGTPFSLLIYNNVLVVPENNADGTWDVAAYMLGSDSLPTLVTDSNGDTISGSGEITAAILSGSTVHVTDSTGATTDVALE